MTRLPRAHYDQPPAEMERAQLRRRVLAAMTERMQAAARPGWRMVIPVDVVRRIIDDALRNALNDLFDTDDNGGSETGR